MMVPNSASVRNCPSTLVIGASVRTLAQSGRRGGINILAIDQYGDEDTRLAAKDLMTIPSGDEGLDPDLVLKAMTSLDPSNETPVVLGGGLDSRPDLVEAIAQLRPLVGNTPALHAQVKKPTSFFNLMDALSIPYPEICWKPPVDPEFWLLKTGCSEGGRGVRSPTHDLTAPGDFYQRHVAGPTYSVLFLSNGESLKIIGFNTLSTIAVGETPYLFAGATNLTNLGTEIQRQVATFVQKLVRYTGLTGLNSMDFMLDPQKRPLVLEINPRPSATMALYDRDEPLGLLRAHINAVKGHLAHIQGTRTFRAFRVVLAPQNVEVTEPLTWPTWCQDRPSQGSMIKAGAPFCTVSAEAASPHCMLASLEHRIRLLTTLIANPIQNRSFSYPV